jgi:hypothetical protein
MYGAADGPAPTPGGAAGGYSSGGGGAGGPNYSHWVDVEVALPGGERGAVRSVEGGTATVAVGADDGEGGWSYPPDAPIRSVPVADMQLVLPTGKGAVRIISGEMAGQSAELVGIDGGDGIVKFGSDIKIYQLAQIGRLAAAQAAS